MKFSLFLFLFSLNLSFAQDTIRIPFNSELHLKYDLRDFAYELEFCVVFAPNNYHTALANGNYVFYDSVSNATRLHGKIQNGTKQGKWKYFDSLGILRIEDIFLNDADSTVITNYFNSNGDLFRIKEGSRKYLRTVHYNEYGIRSYYYANYPDSTNTQMSFDNLGRVTYQSAWYEGKKHGIFFWTYKDGSLYSKEFYVAGKKEGTWLHRLQNDSIIWCTQEYSDDKLLSISFYGKNKYKIGQGEQVVTDYYDNGNIRLSGIVKDGYIFGDWLFYDIEGKQIAKFKHDDTGNLTSIKGSGGIPGI